MKRLSLNRKEWPFRLAFFVGVPLLLSLPLGLFQAGYGQYFTPLFSFLYWVPIWTGIWLAAEVSLRVLHNLLRPWNTPILMEIIVSYALVVMLTAVIVPPYMEYFSRFGSNIPTDFFARRVGAGGPNYLIDLGRSGLPGLVAWTLLRTLYAMLPDAENGNTQSAVAPYSAQAQEAVGHAPPSPGESLYSPFRRALANEGLRDLGRISALQASDHYVDVHLNDGSHILILSRFSDAVETMAKEDGLRIHRSFWVRRDAIADVRHQGSVLIARLKNGLECPVSTKYRGLFEHFVGNA